MVSQVTDQADHLVVCKRCHDKKDMAKNLIGKHEKIFVAGASGMAMSLIHI